MISDVRDHFPILTQQVDGHPLAYLDNAATTQKPRQVLDAIVRYYSESNANVGRSVHAMSMRATDAYEAARETVRGFVGAAEKDEIVFTKGTTESVNLVAEGFVAGLVQAGDEIVVSGMEHHSNLLPWHRVCQRTGAVLRVVPTDAHGEITAEAFAEQLGPRTRFAAVAHVSNVQGTVNPIAEISAVTRERGIPLLVDGAQAVAHRAVDVQALGADFYCFSGHKMYAPMGIGVLYGRAELLERTNPLLVGGGMVRHVTADGPQTVFKPPALFEGGTPNIAGAVGLAAAVEYLTGIGMDQVTAHDAELTARAAAGLRALDGVRLFGAQQPSGGLVSFAVDGLHPYDVGNHLSAGGIMTRTGVHCAMPFVDSLGVIGTVRASFAVYNTPAEVDRFVATVATAEKGFWTNEHPNERFLSM
ncbi:aminotransferase class V-fold PLP-dependent enzyme [Streptomyces sp. MMG1121]|uniref:aminotransferase class V-fold PLP-dependent enzyme n=1 Tax=Streptomyces sp. MMG1121 TaxID=1415544 RepID=UPI0006B02736|nr:cysteine desulfurase [Streptomyces sp. MMG1121]KOV67893.1 cysteine sulfinate desulfinase [Streptomyces sp. MMG1121]